jgi:hypothetical protein
MLNKTKITVFLKKGKKKLKATERCIMNEAA